MENLYTTNILEYRYHLQADEFGQDPDEIFLSKLKKEIEQLNKLKAASFKGDLIKNKKQME